MKTYSINRRNINFTLFLFSTLFLLLSCDKADELPTIKDIDGNKYHYVTIGSQIWLVENLKTTHFSNGDPISIVKDNNAWSTLTSAACCFYDNDTINTSTFGYLYNWYAVNDSRGIAPDGWRVANKDDWEKLFNYVGGIDVASAMLKETGTKNWDKPNEGATNKFGFTALPGGTRYYNSGVYGYLGYDGYWWTSTESSDLTAWFACMNAETTTAQLGEFSRKKGGLSIRCVKDKINQ